MADFALQGAFLPERFCVHSGGLFSAVFGLVADFLYVLINSTDLEVKI